ncbi:MAG: FAD-binding protein [Clostridia bacterium]|nr:FAD-binding protein [Clostridia bacterium]
MKQILAILLSALLLAACVGAAAEATVWTADAQGNNGRVYVTVQIEDGAVKAVDVDTNYETGGLGDVAAQKVAEEIVAGQTLLVDAVAGATFSSKAVLAAVETAIAEAGLDPEAFKVPADASAYNQTRDPIETDVIVVGGGLAGLVAANRAAEDGARVVLVEKSGVLGGAARYAMGWISGAGFRIQQGLGVEDSPELFYSDIVGFAGSEEEINVDLAKYYAEASGPAIDWMQDNGVEFKDELNVGIYDPMSVYRVAWGLNNGFSLSSGMEKKLNENVEAGMVQVLTFHKATELILEDGAVVGVKAFDSRNNEQDIFGRSTILAAGGYGASRERLESIFDNIGCGYITTALGEGCDLAEQAGAGFHHLDYNPITGGVLPNDGFYSNIRMNVKYNGVIYVNLDGDRVFDEIGSNYKARSDAWIHAPANTLWGILAEPMLNPETPVLNAGNSWFTTADTDWAIWNSLVEEGELIVKADTLEELAEKIGAANLPDTVNAYNGYAAAGKDEQFGRADNLIAFEEGPFYAIKTIPYAGRSAGGPLTNGKLEVLTEAGEVIPGLYAAGETVGFAVISGEASVSGMYLGMAATYGIGAADSAASYAIG